MSFVILVPVIAVLEDTTTIKHAFARSAQLSNRYYGRTLFVLLFLIGLTVAIMIAWGGFVYVLHVILNIPSRAANDKWGTTDFVAVIGGIFAVRMIAPWAVAAVVLMYYDLRSRKEAYDFRLLLEDLWRG